jgi:hypothetical protein
MDQLRELPGGTTPSRYGWGFGAAAFGDAGESGLKTGRCRDLGSVFQGNLTNMNTSSFRKGNILALAALGCLSLVLAGCSGDDGRTGPPARPARWARPEPRALKVLPDPAPPSVSSSAAAR